jgi:hypothetical protein
VALLSAARFAVLAHLFLQAPLVNATLPFILPFKMSGGLSLSLPFTAHDKFQTLQICYFS